MTSRNCTDIATVLFVVGVIGGVVVKKFPQVGTVMIIGGYFGAGAAIGAGFVKMVEGK